jgi:hypothetical protein
MPSPDRIAQVTVVANMSQLDKIERLTTTIKKFYDIDVSDVKLVKNQTTHYTANTSLGRARIYVYSQCIDIKFTSTVAFDGQQLTLKKSTSVIQSIFDDINKRTVIFHAVKLKNGQNKDLHFYENTKFSIKIVVRFLATNPQLYFKATPYSKYSFFNYMNETARSGYNKTLELYYLKDEFDSITGVDQAFSFIKDYFKGRNLTLEDAKRLGDLHDMVKI